MSETTKLLAAVWAGWFSIILVRFVIPPILPLIEADLNISRTSSGLLMSAYLFPYALMQVPAGIISDRVGSRRLIAVGIFGSSVATALSWFTYDFGQLLVLRAFAGTFAGLFFAPSTALVASRESKRTGSALGITFTGGPIARTVIYLLVGLLVSVLQGWRPFYLISSIPGLIAGPAALILIDERNSGNLEQRPARSMFSTAIPQLLDLMRSRVIIAIFLFNLMISVAEWGLTTFTPEYLVYAKQVSVSLASLLSLVSPLFGIFAAPFSGYLSDRFGFAPPTLIAMISMCIVSSLLPALTGSFQLIPLFSAWGFLGGLWWTASITLVTSRIPREIRGAFLGLYNSMNFFGGTLGPIILGLVVDVAGFQALYLSTLLIYIFGIFLAIRISRSKAF
jgi:MFS family permease